jgi:phosphoribosyl-ATP pyrophosphohydrolase
MLPKFKQLAVIRKGQRGTLDKCREELAELRDADNQSNRWHVVVEAADLINSTYTFVWRKYRVPFFVVILVALLTSVYKPVVRFLRRFS